MCKSYKRVSKGVNNNGTCVETKINIHQFLISSKLVTPQFEKEPDATPLY